MSWAPDLILPPADQPVARWHVSPVVDVVAYHFSWLLLLVPLALVGDRHPKDYITLWALGITITYLHRHYTLVYAYLDRDTFREHFTRATLFNGLLLLGFVDSAFLAHWRSPPGFLRPYDVAWAAAAALLLRAVVQVDRAGVSLPGRALVRVAAPFVVVSALGIAGVAVPHHAATAAIGLVALAAAAGALLADVGDGPRRTLGAAVAIAVAGLTATLWADTPLTDAPVYGSAIVGFFGVISAVWGVWHVMMQKFGILRLYAAKSGRPPEDRPPAWVDHLLVFGMFPAVALYVGPRYRAVIESQVKNVTRWLSPLIDALEAAQPWLLPIAVALAVGAVGVFVAHERRAGEARSWPRLSMALSLVLLNASFLFVAPMKVYLAYNFCHAVEYIVFVWAFVRRRVASGYAPDAWLSRAAHHPWKAYGGFALIAGSTFFLFQFGDDFGVNAGALRVFDVSMFTWLFTFAIWHSFAHYYFDGFLWKIRKPAVRESL